jgi:hypothetical protein
VADGAGGATLLMFGAFVSYKRTADAHAAALDGWLAAQGVRTFSGAS